MVVKNTLENGVRMVKESMPGARSVSIGIWILAGSRNEDEKTHGISHLIEHMLFKGTSDRSAKDIAEAFDAIGGHVNAFTSKEYTCLYATVVDQHAEVAWNILADMLLHSTFDPTELEKEKKVIEEEIDMVEDTPDDVIHDYLHEITYQGHPLGNSILGTKNTLNHISREDILNYQKQYYVADRIVVSIAGNVDDSLQEHVLQSLENLPRSGSIAEPMYSLFSPSEFKTEKEANQGHLCLGFKGFSVEDERLYEMMILDNVLGGSMSSRLFQDIREDRGLAYSVFSYHSTFRDNGMVVIYGGTNPNQMDEMEEVIQRIIRDLSTKGMTEKEINQTKEQLKGHLILGMEHSSSRMQKNGRTELLNLPHNSLDEIVHKLERVSVQQVNELANLIFENNQSRALILPRHV